MDELNIAAGGEPGPGWSCQPVALVPVLSAMTWKVWPGLGGVVPVLEGLVMDDPELGLEVDELPAPVG